MSLAYNAHRSRLDIVLSKSNRVLPPESRRWWNVGLAMRTANRSASCTSLSLANTTINTVAISSTTRNVLLAAKILSVYIEPKYGMRLRAGQSTPNACVSVTCMSSNMPLSSRFQHENMASSLSSGSMQSWRLGFRK